MLIINGADDVHVPQTDTLVFQGRPDTEVHLIPGTGHCAASKLLQVMQIVISWLPRPAARLPAGHVRAWPATSEFPTQVAGAEPSTQDRRQLVCRDR